jgi:hypothetical protein
MGSVPYDRPPESHLALHHVGTQQEAAMCVRTPGLSRHQICGCLVRRHPSLQNKEEGTAVV